MEKNTTMPHQRQTSRHSTISALQTFRLGQRLARRLRGGEVIALIGELGAGKTTLVKGLAAGLGIRRPIRSPTFLLLRAYPVRGHKKILQLVHVDAYRLKHPIELLDVGFNDYLAQPDTVTIIEWADKIPRLLPRQRVAVRLKMGRKPNVRTIWQSLLRE